jgi:hypothetical protein
VDTYTKLAMDWLAAHPSPASVTTDPTRWAGQTGRSIRQRIQDLVDQLAPPIQDEPFLDRVRRLNAARQMAMEVALDEYLPTPGSTQDETSDWTPLMPDLSDLL